MERFCGERLENNIMLESGAERTMVKISIIIPIFNNEEYLEQCIESVQRQTVKELEIICVDDGSKDQSAELIRRLRQEDARIILHQQENRRAALRGMSEFSWQEANISLFWMPMTIIGRKMHYGK